MTRTNPERSESTRSALLEAAHALFVERGYAATSTPEICAAAGMTRGALYHHYADKAALFHAVLEREAQGVRQAIDKATASLRSPRTALLAGSDAYLDAMAQRGRTRLLLLEGPAVLGPAAMAAIDASQAESSLREGLQAALRRDAAFIAALAGLVSAAFDRAALDIHAGADPASARRAMRWLIERVLAG